MAIENRYLPDYEKIMLHQYDNGADHWTTADKRLIKGAPFTTFECVHYLLELGMEPTHPLLMQCADLIFDTWREDGRYQLIPKGAIYPCQTAHAVKTLCCMGYVNDVRVEKSLSHLLKTQYADGGWRCNKFSFGRGPETLYSNPFPTLIALDAFRYSKYHEKEPLLDKSVDFLLDHWVIRQPIGPCHYGIGSLFMQVEYPFRNYNLFYYVYVLSFYQRARNDKRFLEAFEMLKSKTIEGQIIVERVVPKLSDFIFCKKNQPSELATRRYQEILTNIQ